MREVIITVIISITLITLYTLSIVKSKVETNRLQMKCEADRAELELRKEMRYVRPPYRPVD